MFFACSSNHLAPTPTSKHFVSLRIDKGFISHLRFLRSTALLVMGRRVFTIDLSVFARVSLIVLLIEFIKFLELQLSVWVI